ncbi:c-type cytochrome [Sinimarinibacterium sp. CAU 1509]|nr:c-type cytochrome [Sinimarinibacterium sp. CAU 1509]
MRQGVRVPAMMAALLCCGAWAGAPPLGLPPLPIPADNPQTPAKIALGDALFHDARFSSTGEIACKNCHLDAIAFHDGRPVAKGVRMQRGTRNAPTVVNAAYYDYQFWDGRAQTLEQQALQPLLNPIEHGLRSEDEILNIVRRDANYVARFAEAFGASAQSITITHLTQAIAAYERTLISGDSAFDRWYYGGDLTAMSDSAKRGFEVFTGPGHCAQCHTVTRQYALFTDQAFHNANASFALLGADPERRAAEFMQARTANIDQRVLSDREASELGRFAVTGRREDLGAFKTPSLRNIARTPPYLHDGSLNTLEKVVEYFNNGGKLNPRDPGPNPFQSPLIRPLNLSAEQKRDLVAFLKSLTSPEYAEPAYRG